MRGGQGAGATGCRSIGLCMLLLLGGARASETPKVPAFAYFPPVELDSNEPFLLKRQARTLRTFLQAPGDLQRAAQTLAHNGEEPWPSVLEWLRSDADMAFASPIVGIWDEKETPQAAWNDFVSLAP